MSASLRGIRELHEAYVQGTSAPTAVAQEYIDAIGRSRHNAFITVCADRALEQAEKAEALLKDGGSNATLKYPLLGVPVAVKDNMVLSGVRTTCASKILDDFVPSYTATALKRLESAGAVLLGKLNCDEFAMGGSNENSAYGPVIHPTHADRVPGGSSGGSAAAVGAGLCLASLGSDTGGSVRLPAAFCGVVGLKPTYGRVSRYGLVAFGSSLDQIGPLGRSVDDVQRVYSVIAGHDPLDSTSAPVSMQNTAQNSSVCSSEAPKSLKGFRIGIPKEYFVQGLNPEVDAAVRGAIDSLKEMGAELVPVSLPHTSQALAVYYLVAVSEASTNLSRFDGVRFGPRPEAAKQAGRVEEFYEAVRSQFGPEVKRRIILGTFALSSGYSDQYYRKACQVRRLVYQDFLDAFKKCDLIVSPVAPTTAFKLGAKTQDPLEMYLTDIFTIPASLAGVPAISVPRGMDQQGLPIGVQLIAPHFEESRLFSVGRLIEQGGVRP